MLLRPSTLTNILVRRGLLMKNDMTQTSVVDDLSKIKVSGSIGEYREEERTNQSRRTLT